MSREKLNLVGHQYGKLIVLEFAYYKGKRPYWRCQCDCGNIHIVSGPDLRSGSTKSCGCLHHNNSEIKNKELIGQKFYKLTITEYLGNRRFKCICECGTVVEGDKYNIIYGRLHACWCSRLENLISRKFDKLEVINFHHFNKSHVSYWLCKCDCGKEIVVSRSNLITKHTKSCGCTRKQNLKGKIFGKLTVLKFSHYNNNGDSYWYCQCSCGNTKIINGQSIIHGNTKSCGCLQLEISKNKYKGTKDICKTYFLSLIDSSIRRNLEFNITQEYIQELLENQNYKCKLSNRIICGSRNSQHKNCSTYQEQTASLDRIDSSKGYIKGNVQWVHKDVNKIKWDFDQNYFLNLCKDIAQNTIYLG